jgi:hypothetical protein
MSDTTHTVESFMRENNLTSQDVILILTRHLNDVEFERDLAEVYEGDEWGDWAEGDIV